MRKRVFLNTKIVERPQGFCHERGDCTVRALSNSTALTYDEAYDIAIAAGRKFCGYAHSFKIIRKARELTPFIFTKIIDSNSQNKSERMTLKKFLEKFNRGNYYVKKRNHAFAVVDGQPIDNGRLREQFIVTQAWRVEI